jgi:hypothetical protein
VADEEKTEFLFTHDDGTRLKVTGPPNATIDHAQDKLKALQQRLPGLKGTISEGPQAPRGLPPPQAPPAGFAEAAEHQQRFGMPPASQQIPEIASRTAQGIGQVAGGLPRAAKHLTEGALGNVPGQDPQYLGETVRQAADVGMLLPWNAAAAERGMVEALNGYLANPEADIAGTDIGIFKLGKSRTRGSSADSFEIFDHDDKRVGDLRARYNPDTKQVYIGWLGAYGKSPLDMESAAARLNEGAHAFSRSDVKALGQAIKDKWPDATSATGFRVSGVHSQQRGMEVQTLPLPRQTTSARSGEPPPPELVSGDVLPPEPPRSPPRRWSNPEIDRVVQEGGGWRALNRQGFTLGEGVSRESAMARALNEGAQVPPPNTLAHQRLYGMPPRAPLDDPLESGGGSALGFRGP